MKSHILLPVFLLCAVVSLKAQNNTFPTGDKPWWQQNTLRVIQTNLPDYKAATLNPDSLVKDLVHFSANTLIINAGGIMAFYPTRLSFQYINPYMKANMLRDVIAKCHQNGVRVIVRFDFSRVHESIFRAHPDWCYISPKQERIINTDMYAVSFNAPYVQQKAFDIISEVMDNYPIDGIFLNMPCYQVNNAYEGKYYGIDQNEADKKRFYDYSKGLALPTQENAADTVYQKYLEFKKYTADDWAKRLYDLVKAKSKQVAICTYTDKYVDIIRHESQADSDLPYWPYSASDNVNNASHSYPGHIISNASIQQISFRSRFNAVEPGEVAIRLYENIANGSGPDVSMVGDMRSNEDTRNFGIIRKIYAFHKAHEQYFGNYTSLAKVALISPGLWPAGLPMQEYRGIQLMLKEAHIQFDVIVNDQIASLAVKIKNYKLILLPETNMLSPAALQALKAAVNNGADIIATSTALSDTPDALADIFGAKIMDKAHDGSGSYIQPDSASFFNRLKGQRMVMLKYNVGLYDLSAADERYLPILSNGRPGPPEIVGGNVPTGNYAMSVKKQGKGLAVLIPFNIGRLYYNNGYQEHKNIFLDVIDHICPQATEAITTNAPARVEVILQQFDKNRAAYDDKTNGLILHLVNLTGFSGATYFDPLPVYSLAFKIYTGFKPNRLTLLASGEPVNFSYNDGYVNFSVKQLDDFASVLIDR